MNCLHGKQVRRPVPVVGSPSSLFWGRSCSERHTCMHMHSNLYVCQRYLGSLSHPPGFRRHLCAGERRVALSAALETLATMPCGTCDVQGRPARACALLNCHNIPTTAFATHPACLPVPFQAVPARCDACAAVMSTNLHVRLLTCGYEYNLYILG